MKIVNTYKQGCITWFEYKAVYLFMTSLHACIQDEWVLSKWLAAEYISKRTKDTV